MATFIWKPGATADWNTNNWTPTAGAPPGLVFAGVDVATFASTLTGNKNTYLVTVAKNETFDVATINIGETSLQHNAPSLSIFGTLSTDLLNYSSIAGAVTTNITLNVGSVFDIRTSITDAANIAEAITVTATGKGGVGSGAHLELGSLAVNNVNVSFNFTNNSATTLNTGIIEFQSGFATGSSTIQHINNVAWGDEFIVDGANFTGDTVSLNTTTHVLSVLNGANTVFTMNNVNLQAGAANNFAAFGNVIMAVCYARGTMIRTPDGEIPVERLRAGRQVMTLVDGEQTAQPVKWLGHRRIDLTSHPQPETVAPIRILRGAFADNMPQRDLVVSPDHAIFVDGSLICARQLVNGSTIRQETNWTAVDYYHVELDQHAILLAEGLPAESYIDTGNSGFFYNSGAPLVLRPDLTDNSDRPTREAGSCAPFVWDEATVRPVWQRLADRASQLGRPVPVLETTTDTGLQLVAKGRRTKPVFASADLVIFALPRGASEVELMSRAASPTDARPWLDDRRRLGVQVARIVLRSADEVREIPVDHPDLGRGWWAIEREGQAMSRWTDGEAVLPLPAMRGDTMLEIHLAGTMTYVVESAAAAAAEAGRRAA